MGGEGEGSGGNGEGSGGKWGGKWGMGTPLPTPSCKAVLNHCQMNKSSNQEIWVLYDHVFKLEKRLKMNLELLLHCVLYRCSCQEIMIRFVKCC